MVDMEVNAKKKKKMNKNRKADSIEEAPVIKAGKNLKRKQIQNSKKVQSLGKKQKVNEINQGSDSSTYLQSTEEKLKANKHVVFDDDDDDATFDDLPALRVDDTFEAQGEREENSDSDAPPDETTLSMGKDIFVEEDRKMKNELIKLKNQVKEARRVKHQKNREQQIKKRERLKKLEESRLPVDLLDAVVMEKDEGNENTMTPKKNKKRKIKDNTLGEVDDIVTLEKGVKVQAIHRETRKFKSISTIAADFRQQALYKQMVPRMSSRDHRMMDIKQKKAGKNLL